MQKIVIRTPNWLGDSIMSIPTVVGVKKIFPDVEVWIWTKKNLADLWKFIPEVKGVIGEEEKLKIAGFDLGILLTNSFSSAIKMYFLKIPERRGYSTNFRSFLLTQPVKIKTKCKDMHQIDYFLGIIEGLGIYNDRPIPKIIVPEDLKAKTRKELINLGWDGKSLLIGVHAAASYGPAKRWIPERFEKLADEMVSRYNTCILMVGSEGEKSGIEEIIKNNKYSKRIINIAGKTDLTGLIGMISNCGLFVANDSGPMHLAASIGVPLIAIFGSTDPLHTGPRGEKCNIIYKKVSCSPCFERECNKDLECMKLIETNDVIKAAKELMGEVKM